MSNVQGPLVLLPVSGKGVLAHVDGGRLLHRVDQEIADCQWEEGGCVCVCVEVLLLCTVTKKTTTCRVVAIG